MPFLPPNQQRQSTEGAGQRHEMELATAAAITIKSFNVTEKSSGTTEQWCNGGGLLRRGGCKS